jgi:hypothetical protein
MKILLLIAALQMGTSLLATNWYVTPKDGLNTDTGDGSQENPWDLFTAVQQSNRVHAGDTIWLAGGTYQHSYLDGGDLNHRNINGTRTLHGMPTKLVPALNGAAGNPIVIRALPGARATLNGYIDLASSTSCSYIRWQDLEVCNLYTKDRLDHLKGSQRIAATFASGAFFTKEGNTTVDLNVSGINVSSGPTVRGMEYVNCIVHDNLNCGIGDGPRAIGTTVYGCLIYHNGFEGWGPLFNSNQAHGHGIYAQNANNGYGKTFKNVISVGNSKEGCQFNGTGDFYNNYEISGCTFYQNGHICPSDKGSGWDICFAQEGGSGAVVRNCRFSNNNTFNVGQSDAGTDNCLFGAGIPCVGQFMMTNNIITVAHPTNHYGLKQALFWNLPARQIVSSNFFYGGWFGNVSRNYPNNTFAQNLPTTGTTTIVQPNAYEAGRANIIIYNWNKSDTVSVDLSNVGLRVGTKYELHQCQDYFKDITTGIYDGAPVTIRMANHTVAAPVGTNMVAEQTSFPAFGAFILKVAVQ